MLAWARITNHWVCGYVLKDGVVTITGKELGVNIMRAPFQLKS